MRIYKHRVLNEDDLFVVGSIDSMCFGRLSCLTLSGLETEAKQAGTTCLVGLLPNCGNGASAIGGYVMYRCHQKSREGSAGLEVVRVAVDPSYQRQGLGLFLVSKVARHMNAKRPELVTCVPDSFMPVAHLFFKACGFKPAGILRRHDGEQDYTRMVLPLQTEAVI